MHSQKKTLQLLESQIFCFHVHRMEDFRLAYTRLCKDHHIDPQDCVVEKLRRLVLKTVLFGVGGGGGEDIEKATHFMSHSSHSQTELCGFYFIFILRK